MTPFVQTRPTLSFTQTSNNQTYTKNIHKRTWRFQNDADNKRGVEASWNVMAHAQKPISSFGETDESI